MFCALLKIKIVHDNYSETDMRSQVQISGELI